ncbi:MAG: DegV family protein [Lachnospiraceae bacterium]|nr:DegV family protein [Lachnospiraceae bacterium]
MKKTAIVTDSNSGITQAEGKERGIFVLPMPFMIDEVPFLDDVNLTHEEFYEKLLAGSDVVTSQPSPESVTSLWDEILKDFDEIIHIPMSSGLSGSCHGAMVLSEDYKGKVHVVDNVRISVTLRQAVKDAQELLTAGKTAPQIKEILEADKLNCSVYIMLDTLYYLKKGGRITKAAAMLGTVLKIKPVLQIQGDKLDAFAKARTAGQGKTTMINAIRNDMVNRFGGESEEFVNLHIAHSNSPDEALLLKAELENIFPGMPIVMNPLSLSVACHIGPGALAIAVTKKLLKG